MNMNAKHDELRLLLSRMAPSQEDLDDQHRMPRSLKAMFALGLCVGLGINLVSQVVKTFFPMCFLLRLWS